MNETLISTPSSSSSSSRWTFYS